MLSWQVPVAHRSPDALVHLIEAPILGNSVGVCRMSLKQNTAAVFHLRGEIAHHTS
jgi:hypothetical protein